MFRADKHIALWDTLYLRLNLIGPISHTLNVKRLRLAVFVICHVLFNVERGITCGVTPGWDTLLESHLSAQLRRKYLTVHVALSPSQNPLEYITMAALSKIFAVATTYPYQVIRARLQDQHNKYNGALDVIGRTWR